MAYSDIYGIYYAEPEEEVKQEDIETVKHGENYLQNIENRIDNVEKKVEKKEQLFKYLKRVKSLDFNILLLSELDENLDLMVLVDTAMHIFGLYDRCHINKDNFYELLKDIQKAYERDIDAKKMVINSIHTLLVVM